MISNSGRTRGKKAATDEGKMDRRAERAAVGEPEARRALLGARRQLQHIC